MLRELALHVLDLAENSINASATLVRILVTEDTQSDMLVMQVADNGRGMFPDQKAQVADPFFTTRTTRKVGLGLPFLKQAAEMCNGSMSIESAPGSGTTVTATFQLSHLDRMPLGDLPGTMLTLIIGYPQVDFEYEHIVDGKASRLDTRTLKAELDGVSLSEPEVIAYVKELLGQ